MKSEHGLRANSGATVQCVSEEERILRWEYANGELPGKRGGIMEKMEFNSKIFEIRGRTGKP